MRRVALLPCRGALAGRARIAAIAIAASVSSPAAAEPPQAGKHEPAPAALSGETIDYPYDGKDIQHPERAWTGRAYLPTASRKQKRALPLVVFLHGLNKELIPHRWMGGGNEGDVRRIVGDLVDQGSIRPVLVAGPSSVVASAVSKGASWAHFDLDHFIDRTQERLEGRASIDEAKIIVVGHSGAGCTDAGGLATAGDSRRPLLAIFSVDTCMGGGLAQRLGAAKPSTHVVVTYQSITWSRPFDLFRTVFEREAKASPPDAGVLRIVEQQTPKVSPHNETLPITLKKWLPRLLPPL
jgi:hypothetical protein